MNFAALRKIILAFVVVSDLASQTGAEPNNPSVIDRSSPLRAYATFAHAVLECDVEVAVSSLYLERQLDQPWIDALREYLLGFRKLREQVREEFGDKAAAKLTEILAEDEAELIGMATKFIQRVDRNEVEIIEETLDWAKIDATPFGSGVLRMRGEEWFIATTLSVTEVEGANELNELSVQLVETHAAILRLQTLRFALTAKLMVKDRFKDFDGLSKYLREAFRSGGPKTTQPS